MQELDALVQRQKRLRRRRSSHECKATSEDARESAVNSTDQSHSGCVKYDLFFEFLSVWIH